MMNDSALEVSHHPDNFEDEELWNDEENLPPPVSQFTKITNLEQIPEESHVSVSRSTTSITEKESSENTENTQAPTPSGKARRSSISFDADSFGTIEDKETLFQKEEEDCNERNRFRPAANVSHDDVKIRSWEPSAASFNLTKASEIVSHPSQSQRADDVSQRSVVNNSKNFYSPVTSRTLPKHVTSTPKSGRSPNIPHFSNIISEIRESPSMNFQNNVPNNNDSSSFSTSAVGRFIKNIKAEQSTTECAKDFLVNNKDLSRRVEKHHIFLNKIKNNSQSKQQKAAPVVTRLPTVHERPSESFSNRPPSITGAEIAIKPEPLSHWGFVAVGEEVRSTVYVHNQTSGILEIEPRLNVPEGNTCAAFRLISKTHAQIEANETHAFDIIFAPDSHSRFRCPIVFHVRNSGQQYSHNLLGYGGAVNLRIVQKTLLKASHYPSIYNYTPHDINHFSFEVENTGERTGFVHIVAVDDNESILPNVDISPDKFVILPQTNNSKTTITAQLSQEYVQRLSRMSMASITSAASTTRSRILTLKIHFGDERLRQRAKLFSDNHNTHESYNGLLFTKNNYYVDGNEADAVDDKYLSIQDVNLLKAQTRVMTLVIRDDRLLASTYVAPSSRPLSSQSHRGLPPGYYAPALNTHDLSDVSVANTDKTMMKTRRY